MRSSSRPLSQKKPKPLKCAGRFPSFKAGVNIRRLNCHGYSIAEKGRHLLIVATIGSKNTERIQSYQGRESWKGEEYHSIGWRGVGYEVATDRNV